MNIQKAITILYALVVLIVIRTKWKQFMSINSEVKKKFGVGKNGGDRKEVWQLALS